MSVINTSIKSFKLAYSKYSLNFLILIYFGFRAFAGAVAAVTNEKLSKFQAWHSDFYVRTFSDDVNWFFLWWFEGDATTSNNNKGELFERVEIYFDSGKLGE